MATGQPAVGVRLRRVRSRVVALAVLAAMIAALFPGSGAAQPIRSVPDGQWLGIITFRSATATAAGDFQGQFTMSVSGGVVDGSFDWQGVVATQAGDRPTDTAGVMTGDATEPVLSIESIIVDGFDVPDVSGGGTFLPTRATCEGIEGRGDRWDGGATITGDRWFAIRADAVSDTATFFADLVELRDGAFDLLASLDALSSPDITYTLAQLLDDAELLTAQLARSAECNQRLCGGLLAGPLAEIIRAALANPEFFGPRDFMFIVLDSLRAGVWGSGAGMGRTVAAGVGAWLRN